MGISENSSLKQKKTMGIEYRSHVLSPGIVNIFCGHSSSNIIKSIRNIINEKIFGTGVEICSEI